MAGRKSILRVGGTALLAAWIALGGRSLAGESAVSRDLEISKLQSENVVAVPLDAAVFARAADDFADIRIVDPRGQAVPYWLRRQTETVDRTHLIPVPCEIAAVERPSEEALAVIVRRDQNSKPFDEIEIVTPQRNFEHGVRVSGSDDGRTWTPLVEDGLIVDYSRFVDFGNRKIRLPKNTFRRLKLEIDAPTREQELSLKQVRRRLGNGKAVEDEETVLIERKPLKIERIVGRHAGRVVLKKKDVACRFAIPQDQIAVSEEDAKTSIEVTTGRRPIHALIVKPRTSNFRRSVRVESYDPRHGWTRIGDGTLMKVDLPGLRMEEGELRFQETRSPKIRLTVENGDNPPIGVAEIEAEGPVWECRFVAKPDTAYQMRYGSTGLEKPDYDIQAMQLAHSNGIEPVEGEIAPTEGAIVTPIRGTRVRDVLANPVFVASVILVAALILGASLFHAARRIG